MHTPRKRVPAIRSSDAFRAPMPAPNDPARPRRPQWATHLRDWSCEARLPPPMGLGQQEFVLGDGNMADRSLPIIVGRIARIDAALTSIQHGFHGDGREAAATPSTIQTLTTTQRAQDHTTRELSGDLYRARREIERLQNSEEELRSRIALAETQQADMEAQLREIRQHLGL